MVGKSLCRESSWWERLGKKKHAGSKIIIIDLIKRIEERNKTKKYPFLQLDFFISRFFLESSNEVYYHDVKMLPLIYQDGFGKFSSTGWK